VSFFGALPTPASAYLSGADFSDGVPGERGAAMLDELLAGAVQLATALAQSEHASSGLRRSARRPSGLAPARSAGSEPITPGRLQRFGSIRRCRVANAT
jgi:hypothetical protein